MELNQILQKLRHCNTFNRSLLTKEIIVNIRYVNKTELLGILELLNNTADMEYQVKLISIITAYLLSNNSSRDVIIKSTPLYDTLSRILVRGLPLKTAISLNFVTCLLYADDNEGSRSRTLTLHAQNLIRNSGCLTAMTHMFTNYMLQTETWQALCRCLAEVCRGSELNQNFCSHLVPLCVQRCLQGNADVLPVLQSLLFNHKRNTNLFMETDGGSIFNRKDYLRLETCLQLLNTVIQNAEIEAISVMIKHGGVHENLEILLKMNSANLSIVQWTTVVLYYLNSKFKENGKSYYATTNLKENTNIDSNVNDTQILLQNIMTEILSYPSKTHGRNPLKHLSKVPDNLSNICDISRIFEVSKLYHKEKNTLEKKLPTPLNSNTSHHDRLSFSFLIDESLKFDQDFNNINNNYQNLKLNQTVLDNKKFTQSGGSGEYSKLCDTLQSFNSKCDNMTDFKPTFVSTPKRLNISTKRSSMERINKSRLRDSKVVKKKPKKSVSQEKHNFKQRPMSSRLFEAINESCTTVIRSFKNVFFGNRTNTPTIGTGTINSVKKEDQKSPCSYSFTNYMQKREAELLQHDTNRDVSCESDTLNPVNVCNTCDDTFLLQQKFTSDEQLKSTVKKLKLGINLYGCDFKRISKTMWPRETYMTPNVLYNLYRKLLVK